ncbi:MAG: UDP-N-acetylmuramoyl-L-alanine--D-glutamate ligase [Lachnospiraceae bacterium]|nr:UDP-N-acetylmuramoyl-L-alanine--D-glutamate ligase [Lachnospiraceae bacterium]
MISRDWTKETVLVIGTGISGIGAVSLLAEAGADIVLLEQNETMTQEAIRAKLPEEIRMRPEIYIGILPQEAKERITRVVPSPAVPLSQPLFEEMRKKGVPIDSEIELSFAFEKGSLIAITGTNGKTTTTSLVYAIVEAYGRKEGFSAFLVGNIGKSYALAVSGTDEKSVSVGEISSFQLEAVHDFHARVAAITNITPDHLDRHGTMEEYIRAKKQVVLNQTKKDACVLNYEDPVLRSFGKEECPSRVIFFSSERELPEGYFVRGEQMVRRLSGEEKVLMGIHDMRLIGNCNVENVLCAMAICEEIGIPAEDIVEAVRDFPPVEHRIEYVATLDGVDYYNDSKATNPDAAIQGIRAMTKPTFLIAGGYDKHSDYEPWIRAFGNKVKDLVLLGETAPFIEEAARKEGIETIHTFATFEECLAYCRREAKDGDAVLLSPACASWGMFKNYEERGKAFKAFVLEDSH